MEMKNRNKYMWIVGMIGALILLVFAGYHFIDRLNAQEEVEYEKLDMSADYEVQEAKEYFGITPQELDTVYVRQRENIYQDIHQMSHHVIVASEKWGYKDMSLENIRDLAIEIIASDYEDRDILIDLLMRWTKGDLREADKHHNYVWQQLGGTIGQATGVDWEGVPAWQVERALENGFYPEGSHQ